MAGSSRLPGGMVRSPPKSFGEVRSPKSGSGGPAQTEGLPHIWKEKGKKDQGTTSRTQRKPTSWYPSAGGSQVRTEARTPSESSAYVPPHNSRISSRSYQSSAHSHTLPAMSATPSGVVPAGYSPTGVGFLTFISKFARFSSGSSFPHGYPRHSDPRAACSHSPSVGNRPPTQAQYAAASYQHTQVTGRLGCC